MVQPGGGRAGVLGDPQRDWMHVLGRAGLAHILSRGDGDGLAPGVAALGAWLARKVGARAIDAARDRLGKPEEVRGLLRQEPATLLLVEEDDGVVGKAFSMRGGDGRGRVLLSLIFGRQLAGFDLGVQPPVPQHEEAETRVAKLAPLPCPGVCLLAGRIVEPVAGEREVLPQIREAAIAGVIVAVEADVAGPGGVLQRRTSIGCASCQRKRAQEHGWREETVQAWSLLHAIRVPRQSTYAC